MSVPCLFTITLIASLSYADELLKCTGTTITRGSPAVLQCYHPDADLNNVVWTSNTNHKNTADTRLVPSTVGNLTTLTITGLNAPEEFTCNANISTITVIGTAKVNDVVYLAGSSVTLYQPNSVVSCVISDLRSSPASAYWSTGGSTLSGSGVQELGGAVLTPRIEEFAYTSQEMYLTIDNITSTSLYTCSYEFSDGSVLSDVVYAVLRPTTECEHSVRECKTFTACTGQELNENLTCLNQCNQCYDYTPLTYHNCTNRKPMCEEYLNDFSLCTPKHAMTPLAKYCDMCGWCLDMRFKPASLWLPAITLTALCLLTVLTCYKSIEERNDFLPKVQVTSASPESGKIKSFSFKNGDTVIPNRVVEEKGFLGPSAAVEIHNYNNEIDVDQIIIDEGEDGGDAQSIHEYLACSNNNGGVPKNEKLETQKVESHPQKVETQKVETQKVETQKVETQKVETQKVETHSNPPVNESQIVVEGVIEELLTSAIPDSVSRKTSPDLPEPSDGTVSDNDPRLSKGPFLSQLKQDTTLDGDQIESEKLEKEKTDNEKVVESVDETPQVPETPQVIPETPQVIPEQSNGAPLEVVSDKVGQSGVEHV